MKNWVQPGKRVSTYNSSHRHDHRAGSAVVVGNRIRVASWTSAIATYGECATQEVFTWRPRAPTRSPTAATLYWDNTANQYLTTSATAYLAGSAIGAKAPGVTTANVNLVEHPYDGSTVGLTQQVAIPNCTAQTQDTLTVASMTGAANTSPAAETNIDAITATNMTGTAATTPAADTNTDNLTISGLTKTAAGTMADITFNSTWSQGQADSSNQNFKEIATELAKQRTLNAVLANNNKLWQEQHAKQLALNTVLINDAKSFAVELNKATADVANLITKVNAILASDAAAGVRASS